MGRRGPAPKPTNLRILHGDETRHINKTEPQPLEELPQPPYEFDDEEYQRVWDHTVKHLAGMGLAHAADTASLTAYVTATVEMYRSARLVMRSGSLINTATGGLRRNPALVVLNQQQNQVRVFAREFGLTPAARVHFGSKDEPAETNQASYFTA